MGIGVNSTDPAAVTVHGTNPQVSARRVMGSAAPALRMPTPSVLCSAAPARGGCWAVPAAAADADAVRRAAAVAAGGPARARRGACVRCACKARAGAGRVASRAALVRAGGEARAVLLRPQHRRAGAGRIRPELLHARVNARVSTAPPRAVSHGENPAAKNPRRRVLEGVLLCAHRRNRGGQVSLPRARALSLSLSHTHLSVSLFLSLSLFVSRFLSLFLSLSLSLSLSVMCVCVCTRPRARARSHQWGRGLRRAMELDHIGGTFGGNSKPCAFIQLVLKVKNWCLLVLVQ